MKTTETNTNALIEISCFLIAASIGQPRYHDLVSVIRSALSSSIKHSWLLDDTSQEIQKVLWDVDSKFYWEEIRNIASWLSYMDVEINTEDAMCELRRWHYE